MFSLLVKGAGWDAAGRDELTASRLFEHTEDDVIARYRQNNRTAFDQLMAIPALFASEGTENQIARLGTITGVRDAGRTLVIDYTFDQAVPTFQNRTLVALARDLEIGEWELNRTHWAVKSGDLCRTLLRNAPPRRVGPRVFRIAEHENVEHDLVSVMMPFDARYRPVYESLQALCGELGLRCTRADDIWDNDAVMEDVVSLIDRSQIVIADCTGRNPNVFYEIGIAHTLGRNVIMITQAEADVPFDLRHLRFVQYLNNGEGRTGLCNALRRRLGELG